MIQVINKPLTFAVFLFTASPRTKFSSVVSKDRNHLRKVNGQAVFWVTPNIFRNSKRLPHKGDSVISRVDYLGREFTLLSENKYLNLQAHE